MKVKRYADGGVGPGGRRKKVAKQPSAEYQAKREESRQAQKEKAQAVRAQGVYNRAASARAAGETERAGRIESKGFVDPVTGARQPVSAAQTATMGVSGAGASSEAAIKRRPTGVQSFPAPAAKPAAGMSAEDRAARISREVGQYTMDEARKKGLKLMYGGKMKKMK